MRTNGNQDQSSIPAKGQSGQATTGQNAPAQGGRGIERRERPRDLWRGRGGGGERSWGPFGLIGRMFEDLDRAFGLESERGLGRTTGRQDLASLFRPDLEVFEKDGKMVLRADLPGMKPEDVKIEVEADVLTVSGERKSDYETEREGYYESERTYGYFRRSVRLPEGTNAEDVKARFENGVLEVEAPIAQKKPRGRTIPISTGQPGTTGGTQAGPSPTKVS
jgi:HSP20 family protein